MSDAYFERAGDDVFLPTEHTRGPWGPDSQHGGPPAALLGRAIEALGNGFFTSRITFEITAPVPVTPLRLDARVARPGKRVQMVEASLSSDTGPVMLARAWLIRTNATEVAVPEPHPFPKRPDDLPEGEPWDSPYAGYIDAMEWRFAEGDFRKPGPAKAWLRARYPLVDDEGLSPLGRVLIAADSASGVSANLDWHDWLFINMDLSVYLHRLPRGEWVCLDAHTVIESTGVGLASSIVFDEFGAIGRTQQTLLVAPQSR